MGSINGGAATQRNTTQQRDYMNCDYTQHRLVSPCYQAKEASHTQNNVLHDFT